jgi:hypothetical protein
MLAGYSYSRRQWERNGENIINGCEMALMAGHVCVAKTTCRPSILVPASVWLWRSTTVYSVP